MPGMRRSSRHAGRLGAFLVLLCCLLVVGAGALANHTGAPPTLAEALRAGEPLVLVIAPRDGGRARGSEAYADWQAYRDDVLARRGEGVHILQVAPQAYRRRVAQPRLDGEFATLFLRPDRRRGLLHEGMILEPRAYLLGLEYLRGGTVPAEAASYGLREGTIRTR